MPSSMARRVRRGSPRRLPRRATACRSVTDERFSRHRWRPSRDRSRTSDPVFDNSPRNASPYRQDQNFTALAIRIGRHLAATEEMSKAARATLDHVVDQPRARKRLRGQVDGDEVAIDLHVGIERPAARIWHSRMRGRHRPSIDCSVVASASAASSRTSNGSASVSAPAFRHGAASASRFSSRPDRRWPRASGSGERRSDADDGGSDPGHHRLSLCANIRPDLSPSPSASARDRSG